MTRKIYYVVAGDLHERLRLLIEDVPFDVTETYTGQEQALAKVWDDPELDIYNELVSPAPSGSE